MSPDAWVVVMIFILVFISVLMGHYFNRAIQRANERLSLAEMRIRELLMQLPEDKRRYIEDRVSLAATFCAKMELGE